MGSLSASAKTTLNGPNSTVGTGWALAAAPNTRITSLALWWAYQVNPVSVPPFGRIQIYAGTDSLLVSDEPDHGTFAQASPSIAYSSGNLQSYDGLSVSTLGIQAWCGNHCGLYASTITATYEAYRVRVTVDDPTPPTGSATGLADGDRVGGPTPVAVTASDVGGGVRTVSLRVDGQAVDTAGADGTCDDVDARNTNPWEYNLMKPCPTQRDAVLTLQPGHLPDGDPHTVTVVATDAAGQETVLLSARVARPASRGFFDAASGFQNPDLDVTGPRQVNGVNGGPARMAAAFAVKRGRGRSARTRFVNRRTVSYGQQPLFAGRLTTPEGTPIVGARVWLASALRGGAWSIVGQPLITSAVGVVSGRVPATGPSRQLRLVYFPYTDANGHGTTSTLSLKVRAPVRLSVTRRRVPAGGALRLIARLRSDAFAGRAPILATVQVRQGGRWRPVRSVRFLSSARSWSVTNVRLRFDRSRPGARFRFRVRVPSQNALRYTTGVSSARLIRIGGR